MASSSRIKHSQRKKSQRPDTWADPGPIAKQENRVVAECNVCFRTGREKSDMRTTIRNSQIKLLSLGKVVFGLLGLDLLYFSREKQARDCFEQCEARASSREMRSVFLFG